MPASLTDKQIAAFRQQLKDRFYALREEVRQELLNSDNEHYVDLASQVPDLADEAVADLLVDINLANIDRHIREIREVDASLLRIAQGSYGECIDCGDTIPVQRLQANPTASRCLDCQERHDKLLPHPAI